jgi:hypothetical protein
MKVPSYITTYRAITVGIVLLFMFFMVLGDVLGPFAALLKGL